jgi:hypothetical protein
MHNWNENNGAVILLNEGRSYRQPIIDMDIVSAIHNIISLNESKGQIYELGGPHKYTIKELMEYLANALTHRPRYINYSYEDFMKLHLSPNLNFEKAIQWIWARPDYAAEQSVDLVINKREGIKTLEDLYITPLAPHHYLNDMANYIPERVNAESGDYRNYDEYDADDDGHA